VLLPVVVPAAPVVPLDVPPLEAAPPVVPLEVPPLEATPTVEDPLPEEDAPDVPALVPPVETAAVVPDDEDDDEEEAEVAAPAEEEAPVSNPVDPLVTACVLPQAEARTAIRTESVSDKRLIGDPRPQRKLSCAP
jgi:hypothetical protein